MDLMKYKQINNRKYDPGKDQNNTGLNFSTDQILQGLQFMGSLYNSFSGNKSVDDLYKESEYKYYKRCRLQYKIDRPKRTNATVESRKYSKYI